MLYNLLTSFSDTYSYLNFFNFLTVRTGLAVITAMIIVFLIGDKFINYFSSKKITNPIRSDGPENHLIKKIGTPTMGGVLILIGLFVGVFLWADLYNPYNWLLIFITLSFGTITLSTGTISIIQSCQTDADNWSPTFFSLSDLQFLEKVLEIIIPLLFLTKYRKEAAILMIILLIILYGANLYVWVNNLPYGRNYWSNQQHFFRFLLQLFYIGIAYIIYLYE